MRYLDGADPFARQRTEASLPPIVPPRLALPAPTVAPVPTTTVEATIPLTRFTPRVRGLTKAQRLIEQICRSEERRVGNECVRTCRYWRAPFTTKKKTQIKKIE